MIKQLNLSAFARKTKIVEEKDDEVSDSDKFS